MKKTADESNSTIMVVDDIPANLDLLNKILDNRGYRVRSFTNGRFALQSARADPPDLVLLDIRMPELDGFTLCRKLKEYPQTSDVPVIFISALNETEDKLKAFESGGVDYITKPFQETEVLARVKTHIGLRHMQIHLENLVTERTSELQDAYADLCKSEIKYRGLFNDALDMIDIIDQSGRIIDANPVELQTLGYLREEYIGKPLLDIIHPDCAEQVEKILAAVFRGKDIHNYETALITKNGEQINVEVNMVPQFEENGAVVAARAIMRNIGDRKRKEREHKELEKRLRQAQKMEAIGTLAGGIAHDFNNILSIIFGYIELAEEGASEPEIVRQHLEEAFMGCERARDLVRHILTFSRQGEQKKQVLKVSLIVKEAVKMLRSTIPSTITIDAHIFSDAKIVADPIQIHQIVMNLCTNSYHAMGKNKGTLSVLLTSVVLTDENPPPLKGMVPGRYLRLTVSDTGIGMDKQTQEKIFDPYFTTKDKGEGTGLGLSVVHGIVKDYNGHIDLHSVPGKGATFDIYLPQADEHDKTAIGETAEEPCGGTENILFIDDDQSIARYSKSALSKAGYRVTAYTRGADAVAAVEKNPEHFQLVITDMTMPQMNGLELAGRLFELNKELPIILCTGYNDLASREKAYAAGIAEYCEKPLLKKQLLHIVRKVLDTDRARGGRALLIDNLQFDVDMAE